MTSLIALNAPRPPERAFLSVAVAILTPPEFYSASEFRRVGTIRLSFDRVGYDYLDSVGSQRW